MSSILRISEAASLALHSMVLLAASPDRLIPTREIASGLHVSEAHLSKVLQRLARVGLVKSTRGPKGGFMLGKAGDEVSLLDVYESIEGPLMPTKCLFDAQICGGEKCILGGLLETVDKQVREYLAETRLSELTSVYKSGKNANIQEDSQY
jgi:Rrf2 family protein